MGHEYAVGTPIPRGHDRTHKFPGRERRINLRIDAAEHCEIVDAARRAAQIMEDTILGSAARL